MGDGHMLTDKDIILKTKKNIPATSVNGGS